MNNLNITADVLQALQYDYLLNKYVPVNEVRHTKSYSHSNIVEPTEIIVLVSHSDSNGVN